MPVPRLIVFLATVVTLTAALHYFLWARLVRDTGLSPALRSAGTIFFAAMAVLLPTSMALSRQLPRAVASPLVWGAMVWLGLVFFLFVLLVPFELARLFSRWAPSALGSALPSDPSRRTMLARFVGGLVSVSAFGLGTAGAVAVVRRVGVKDVRVPLAKLSPKLSGYTIVQLTDVHVGPTIGRDFIEEVVAAVNALDADMVVITGDLVDGSVAELEPHVEPLKRLRAKDGVYFVTGNHEYYSGANAWIAHLESLGIRVLRNERVPIRGEHGFDLAGVDDWTAHQFGGEHGMNLEKALSGRDPDRAVVLLAHQPKAIVEAGARGVDLQLSGHTHGGQLFPFNFLVGLQQPYVAGLHDHGATKIYVSRGTGYWGPPMRVGAPAEITRIELASVEA